MLIDQLRSHIERTGQHEVSRRSGIAQPSISAWLAGRRGMPLERQIEIARACGLRVKIIVTKPNSRSAL